MNASRLLLILSVRFTWLMIAVSAALIGISSLTGSLLPQTPKLAFMGGILERDGTRNFDIFVMDFNRYLIDRVTWADSWERFPAWSPDGKTLAFHSGEPLQGNCGVSYEIYLSSLNGRDVRQLTGDNMAREQLEVQYEFPNPRCNAMPTWSPDGTQIAYTRSQQALASGARTGGAYGVYSTSDSLSLIYLMDIYGENQRAVTDTPRIQLLEQGGTSITNLQMIDDDLPTWSPDGKRIALISTRNGSRDVYVVDVSAKGSPLLQVTNDADYDSNPVWISNDELIYTSLPMTSPRAGKTQLYRVKLISGEKQQIMAMPWDVDGAAWWSPQTP